MKKTYTLILSTCLILACSFNSYAQEGTLDNSFGTAGKVTTSFGPHDDEGYGVAVQTDGKIVVAGWSNNATDADFAVSRYNSNGGLDVTFGSLGTGKVTTPIGSNNDYGTSVAICKNAGVNLGKIVVAGYYYNGTDFDFAVVRYNTNGTLDATFGGGTGITTTNFGGVDIAYSVAIQSDDKIVVVGTATVSSIYKFALARYLPNGNLDVTFGVPGTGKFTTAFGTSSDEAQSVAIDNTAGPYFGRIVVGGYSWNGSTWDFALACYNINGTPDNTFGTFGAGNNGKSTTSFGIFNDRAYTVAIDKNAGANFNKILLGGYSDNGNDWDFAMARYNTNGTLDNTPGNFGTLGKVTTDYGSNEIGYSMAVQSDDKIVLLGLSDIVPSAEIFSLSRYNSNGILDNTFGTFNGGFNGKDTTLIKMSNDGAASLAFQADGKIVIAGCGITGTDADFALARYNVAPPCAITLTPTVTNPTTCGGTNGSITLGVTGAGPFTYNWSGNSCAMASDCSFFGTGAFCSFGLCHGVNQNLSNIPVGTYTVIVTGLNSCTATTTVTVTAPTLLAVGSTISPSATVCAGTSVTLSGTGATSYSWSGGVTNGVAFIPSGTTTYTVTGTSPGGCSGTATSTVTLHPRPTSVITGTQTICTGNTAFNLTLTLTGTPPWNVTVSGGTSPIVFAGLTTSPHTFNLSPSSNTTYTVTSLNDANCTALSGDMTGSAVVTVHSNPVATFNYTGSPFCTSGINPSPNFSGGGAAGVFTSTSGLTINSATGLITLSSSTSGTYTVTNTIASSGGCNSATATTTIVISAVPAAPVISGLTMFCGTQHPAYTASSPGITSYTWSYPAGITSITGQGTSSIITNISNTSSGNVSLVLSCVANGCGPSMATTYTITSAPVAPDVITSVPANLCGATSAIFSIVPVATALAGYQWVLPSGWGTIGATNTSTISVTIPANFVSGVVNVYSKSGCAQTLGTPITVSTHVPIAPVATAGITNVCTIHSGTYTVSAVAGADPNAYVWAVNGTGMSISPSSTVTSATVLTDGLDGGTVTCSAHNTCGTGPAKTWSLSVLPLPPGVITGPQNLCNLTSATYSVVDVTPAGQTGYTYNWFCNFGYAGWLPGSSTINTNTFTNPNLYSPTHPGIIEVKTSNTCGTVFSNITTYPVTYCHDPISMNNSSIEQPNNYSHIYPNPANSEFTIDVASDIDKDVIVEIYDVLGNKVIQQKHQIIIGDNTIKTTIEQYKTGMYFVRLIDADNNVLYTERVIKQ